MQEITSAEIELVSGAGYEWVRDGRGNIIGIIGSPISAPPPAFIQ